MLSSKWLPVNNSTMEYYAYDLMGQHSYYQINIGIIREFGTEKWRTGLYVGAKSGPYISYFMHHPEDPAVRFGAHTITPFMLDRVLHAVRRIYGDR